MARSAFGGDFDGFFGERVETDGVALLRGRMALGNSS